MGVFKWFTGLLGWASMGPIGGLLGYLAGALVERSIGSVLRSGGNGPFGSPDPYAGGQSSGYSSASRGYTVDE